VEKLPCPTRFYYFLEEFSCIWDERGLKLAEANPKDWKVIIIPDGDKTIGKLFEDGNLTTIVETKKHSIDEYSINEAIKSITARLVEKHDERKHNFKIGDIVELVEKDVNYAPIPVGTRGEVVSYSPSSLWDVGVDFKMPYGCYTHDLDMRIKTPTGRWYNADKLKLVHRP
jgi:hypothetical protein